jgi:hypothetical protein
MGQINDNTSGVKVAEIQDVMTKDTSYELHFQISAHCTTGKSHASTTLFADDILFANTSKIQGTSVRLTEEQLIQGRNNEAGGTIIVRPPRRVA